ncbi:hypothetical protein AB0F43_06245 [Kribbella sp. NPDC023972]|uniref:hypothetical protein n=1 Tax=Kribbella sp. NPDC023972 TaxID=3154795 RepID=UPI0034065836
MTNTNFHAGPSMAPPTEVSTSTTEAAGLSSPTITNEQFRAMVSEATVAAPTLTPPTAGEVAVEAGVAATWRSSVKIDALWSIDQTRNAFVHIVDVGWRKIYNGRDGAFQALVSLASQARQTNRIVNLREEADGMIYEIYVW